MADEQSGNFQAIQHEIKAVVARHGGKLSMEEWQYRGDECLRVLIVWKRPTYSVKVEAGTITHPLT